MQVALIKIRHDQPKVLFNETGCRVNLNIYILRYIVCHYIIAFLYALGIDSIISLPILFSHGENVFALSLRKKSIFVDSSQYERPDSFHSTCATQTPSVTSRHSFVSIGRCAFAPLHRSTISWATRIDRKWHVFEFYMFIFSCVFFLLYCWTTTIDFGGESTTFAPSVQAKAWTIPARSNLCILIFHLLTRSIQIKKNPIKKYKLIDRIL